MWKLIALGALLYYISNSKNEAAPNLETLPETGSEDNINPYDFSFEQNNRYVL